MRVRIEGDAERVYRFIVAHDYPHHDTWTPDVLQANAIMTRVEHDATGTYQTAGFVWAVWDTVPMLDSLHFHACIDKTFRARWLEPQVIEDLVKLAELLGANALVTQTPGDRAKRLVTELLVRRMGFVHHAADIVYRKIEDGNVRRRAEGAANRSG